MKFGIINANDADEIIISFNDNTLYNRIRNILADKIKSASDKKIVITKANLVTVTSLDLSSGEDNKFSDLTGIENFIYLKDLKLRANNITDISLLGALERLEKLDISENKLQNKDSIERLKNLV